MYSSEKLCGQNRRWAYLVEAGLLLREYGTENHAQCIRDPGGRH